MISISSDFLTERGDPTAHLKLIAEAGFKNVHWVHHWNDDFVYSEPEIAYLKKLFKELGLSLCGVHATAGQEKSWFSAVEHQRQAGVELVRNRIEMAARLGSDFIVLHAPMLACDTVRSWEQAMKSLEEFEGSSRACGVSIAIENMCNDDFAGIDKAFARHDASFLGLCYDAGHGNVGRADGLVHLAKRADRLLALHLHDNNGFGDQHKLPFTCTLDWEGLAMTLAKAPAKVAINLEVLQRQPEQPDSKAFLKQAFEKALAIEAMVEKARRTPA